MIDHLSLPVSDVARSQAFYDQIFATLGYRSTMTLNEPDYSAVGYGAPEQEPVFWIGAANEADIAAPVPQIGQHVAFSAPDRDAVDRFHQAGLAASGKDNGSPGLRLEYHPNYYAAFLIDPDGHHLEAVCHAAPESGLQTAPETV